MDNLPLSSQAIEKKIISGAQELAQKLNTEIEKGNDTFAFMIALGLAAFKDFLDIILTATLLGLIPGVNFGIGLFLTSFLFFFMYGKGYFLKWRLRFWFWVLGLIFDGFPGLAAFPTNSLLVLYAWRLAKKRAAKAKIKLKDISNLTAQEISSLNNDISILEDGASREDFHSAANYLLGIRGSAVDIKDKSKKETGNTTNRPPLINQFEGSKNPAEKAHQWTELDNHTFNPDNFYRIINEKGYNDLLESKTVRSSPSGTDPKMIGGINIGNRSTNFPSFSKGAPDESYIRKGSTNYILESDHPMHAKGEQSPVTGKRIVSKHWAYRPINPTTGHTETSLPQEAIKHIYKVGKDGSLHKRFPGPRSS